MTRRKLKKRLGERLTVIGVFDRYGVKHAAFFLRRTILFDPVLLADGVEWLTPHLWLNFGRQFEALGKLKKGDRVRFDARVAKYQRGYAGHKEDVQAEKPLVTDYRLIRPSRVVKLEASTAELLPIEAVEEPPEAPGDE